MLGCERISPHTGTVSVKGLFDEPDRVTSSQKSAYKQVDNLTLVRAIRIRQSVSLSFADNPSDQRGLRMIGEARDIKVLVEVLLVCFPGKSLRVVRRFKVHRDV